MNRLEFEARVNPVLNAFVRAIKEPDIEVRVEIDNYDEFLATYQGLLLTSEARDFLDKEKTDKENVTGELFVKNPKVHIELKNGSAVIFKLTDRALAQFSVQLESEQNPFLAAFWTMLDDNAKEDYLSEVKAEIAAVREGLKQAPQDEATT